MIVGGDNTSLLGSTSRSKAHLLRQFAPYRHTMLRHIAARHIAASVRAILLRQFASYHGSYLGDIILHGLQTSFHASAVRAYYIQVMRPVDLKILLQIVITVPAIQKSIGAALDDDFKGSLWNTSFEIRIVRDFTACIFYASIIFFDVDRVICVLCLWLLF